MLLVEQVDRLSRLNDADWEKLKREIKDREVKVVALDLPTSHMVLKSEDAFTGRMFEAVNGMMLDMSPPLPVRTMRTVVADKPRGSPMRRRRA